MSNLTKKKCVPCREGTPPLSDKEISTLLRELDGWTYKDRHHLEKTFLFKDFKEALAMVNRIGAIAENEGHHPDLYLGWGRVQILLWTHKINGLSESDFILAAKCDEAHRSS